MMVFDLFLAVVWEACALSMLSREPILALESENKKLLFFGELRVLNADNF